MELKKHTSLAWRRFLATEAGIEGMLWLREQTPDIGVSDSHIIIFGAGRVQGYKDTLNKISELLTVEPEKQQSLEN